MAMITEAEASEALDAVREWIEEHDPEGEDDGARAAEAVLEFVLNTARVPEGERVQRFLGNMDMLPDGED